GAVRTDDADEFMLANIQAEIRERDHAAIGLRQPVRSEHDRPFGWRAIRRVARRCGERWRRADIKVSAGEPGLPSFEPRAPRAIETAQLVRRAPRAGHHPPH